MSARRENARGVASASSAAVPASATAAGEALVAEAVTALHANGAESDRTAARAQQLASTIGRPVGVELGWSTTTITVGEPAARSGLRTHQPPSALGMNRVLAVDTAIDDFGAGRTDLAAARAAVRRAAGLPAAPAWLFAAACIVGACSLAVILGVSRWEPVAVIAVSAGLGAFLRRLLGNVGASNFWQVGAAALLAGVLGSVAVQAGFSSDLRLAVVCPCMVLVPGPHLLNGMFDIAALRIPLGLSRLTFAAVTLLSIGAGLIAGLAIGGADLVAEPASRDVPVVVDAIAAGVVAVCYGIFYSAPVRILSWPLVAGAVVHALHWLLIAWHWESYLAAGVVCLVVGAGLIPLAQRARVPFAAIGFASVVSLMPGVAVFRALDGLAQLPSLSGASAQMLLLDTIDNAVTAFLTLFCMAVGFVLPASVYRRWPVGGRAGR
ncbi:threonine/serine exporter family protein [Microbacterium sp. NPDC091313]